jgi:uncharacterized membrane protein
VTGWVAYDEFHPISLALPAITFATGFAWKGAPRTATILALLTLLSTEDATVWVGAFGIFLALRSRQGRPWGALVTVVAAGWLAGYLWVLAPALRPASILISDPHPDIGVFVYCGRTWSAVASCVVSQPGLVASQLFRSGGIQSILALLAPSAGIGLFGSAFLVAVPRWLVLLLSVGPGDFRSHYAAVLAPTVFLAVAEAVAWCSRRDRRIGGALGVVALVAAVVGYRQIGPFPGSLEYAPPQPAAIARAATLDAAVALVPNDPTLSVVATSSVLPHLALRPHIYLAWSAPPAPPDYRVIELDDAYPITKDQLAHQAMLWRADPGYQMIFDRNGVFVQKRDYVPLLTQPDANFAHLVTLEGAALSWTNIHTLVVTVDWQLAGPAPANYHYFMHLVDARGQIAGQDDGQLLAGALPATQWIAGEAIRQHVNISLAAPASSPPYTFQIGWYDLATGVRVKLPNGTDFVSLAVPNP